VGYDTDGCYRGNHIDLYALEKGWVRLEMMHSCTATAQIVALYVELQRLEWIIAGEQLDEKHEWRWKNCAILIQCLCSKIQRLAIRTIVPSRTLIVACGPTVPRLIRQSHSHFPHPCKYQHKAEYRDVETTVTTDVGAERHKLDSGVVHILR